MKPSNNTLINTDYLLEKLKGMAIGLGRIGLKPALTLYYVMRSNDTPAEDKWVIVGALSYLIFPFDILSARRLPIIGWIDEIISIGVAYTKMKKHITPEIESKVVEILDKWLPEPVVYEVVE